MSITALILRRLKINARSFHSDESGTAGIIFGGTLAVTIPMLGVAVDYSSAVSAKTVLQSAIDEAVLAAVREPEGTSAEKQNADVIARIKASLQNTGITYVGCDCAPDGNGGYSGKVRATVRTSALQLVTIKNLPIAATATASVGKGSQETPKDVKFQMAQAWGYYWKRITLHKTENGATTEVANWEYQPKDFLENRPDKGENNGRGEGTFTGPTGELNLGNNYTKLHLTMEVASDECGPNMTRDPKSRKKDYRTGSYNTAIACIPSPKHKKIITYSTDDPASAVHLKVDGKFLAEGKAANLLDFIPCGKSTETNHAWEDSDQPFSKKSDSQWKTQDIFMTVKTEACEKNPHFKLPVSRLTK